MKDEERGIGQWYKYDRSAKQKKGRSGRGATPAAGYLDIGATPIRSCLCKTDSAASLQPPALEGLCTYVYGDGEDAVERAGGVSRLH